MTASPRARRRAVRVRAVYGNFKPPRRQVQRAPVPAEIARLADQTLEAYEAYVDRKLPGRFPGKKARELHVEELKVRLRRPERFFHKSILVDCRSYEEFRVSTIKGAIHISKLEERMVVDRKDYVREEMSELVEEVICIDTIGLRGAHLALELQDRTLYYPRIYNLKGGLVHWTHVDGPLHEPLSDELLLFHDVTHEEDWRETDRIHVVADCWKLQRPGMRPVTFEVNTVRSDGGGGGGEAAAADAGTSSPSADGGGAPAASGAGVHDGDGHAAVSGEMDRGCLWFPYTPLRDFWYLSPLNFWKGYMDSAADLNPKGVVEADMFGESDGTYAGYTPVRGVLPVDKFIYRWREGRYEVGAASPEDREREGPDREGRQEGQDREGRQGGQDGRAPSVPL